MERAVFKGDALPGEEQDRHDGWWSQHFPLPFFQFEKEFLVITRVFLEEPHPPKSKSQKELWDVFAHPCTDMVITLTMMPSGQEHSCPAHLCAIHSCGTRRSSAAGLWWWYEVGLLIWGGRSVSVLPSWMLRKVSAVSVLGIVYWVWYGKSVRDDEKRN